MNTLKLKICGAIVIGIGLLSILSSGPVTGSAVPGLMDTLHAAEIAVGIR